MRHVLLGMNAHINYDLPQALLAVISDAEFGDPQVRALREADHRRIDEVLAVRVGAEDAELQRLDPAATWQDRALQPLNRMATRRFLRESRAKVWANALELSKARAAGPDSYAGRLAELEKLCGRRVADLERPGPVLLRLAAGGFGVRLRQRRPPAGPGGPPAGRGHRPARRATGRPRGPPAGREGHRQPAKVTGRPAAAARRAAASRAARWRAAPARARCCPSTRSRSATWRPTCGSPTTAGSGPGSWCPRYEWCTDTFGMDWLRTCHGAWLVLRANQLWAPNPGDPDGARRCMARFYALLLLTHGVPADPARAARLEVDWWAAHREHQYERGSDDDGPLVTALARLYAYVYDTGEEAVRSAAQHRARAMDFSDRWVAAGRDPDSPLIAGERAELVRCYAALLAAVHR